MLKNLSLLAFSLAFFSLNAQDLIDHSLKHSMKQDGLSMQFTVLDPDKKQVKHHRASKTYYWYKAQKVIATQGGNSGLLLDGPFESFYPNKQLCEKGSFSKGLKDGPWLYWNAGGKLRKQELWSKGKQKGKQLYYDNDGELYKVTTIRGRKSHSSTPDSLVELKGTASEITVIDSLGRKLSVARYKNGLLHGKQETYSGDEKHVVVYREGAAVPAKERKRNSKEGESAAPEQNEKTSLSGKLKKIFGKKDKAARDSREPETREKSGRKKKSNRNAEETGTTDPGKKKLFKSKKE